MDNKSPAVLTIDKLTVSYPYGFNKERTALRNFTLEVKKGEVFGLLGPNGAGKTTLIKTIVGLIRYQSGSVTIFGESPYSTRMKDKIGYMPEIANYYWFLTPEEILSMCGQLCGMDRGTIKTKIDAVLETVGLLQEKRHIVRNFSKGMQEKLNIAQALLHDPELLVLDEPFSGLDPLARIHMRNIITQMKEENKTILLSSHELSEAELICDHLCIVKEGSVVKYGSMRTLLEEKGERSLEGYFFKIISENHA